MGDPLHRPTPVRESLGSSESERAADSAAEPGDGYAKPASPSGTGGALEPAGLRCVDTPEGRWAVRVDGATRTGCGSDAGAPLLMVTFTLEGEGAPDQRQVLAVGTSLDALSDEDLADLHRRARAPAPPP